MIDKQNIFDFLSGYKHNSGIFINNFFRGRDYKTYCEDKFHTFNFAFGGMMQHVFDNDAMAWQLVSYLGMLEENEIAYFPINIEFVKKLIAIGNVFDSFKTKEDAIVYRGCTTLERNGVTGLVSTTTNRKIAEQFSRGTMLVIHVPQGTSNIDIHKIRPRNAKGMDQENEMLLPPCDYAIINESNIKRGQEPNNRYEFTKLIELSVQPKNILSEFLKSMQNPPLEYLPIKETQGQQYTQAIQYLGDYINSNYKSSVM